MPYINIFGYLNLFSLPSCLTKFFSAHVCLTWLGLKAKTLEDLNKAGNAKSVLEIPNVNSYQLLLFTMIGPKTRINQFPTDIQASCDSWKSYHTTNFSPLVMLFAFEVVQVVCFLKLWPLSFMQNYCDQYFVVVSSECSVDKRIKKIPPI